MKKLILLGIVLSLLAAPAFAVPTVKLMSWGKHKDNAGELNWLVMDTDGGQLDGWEAGDTFVSFCIETQEHVVFGGVYDAVMNTGAVKGGDPSGFDPLDDKTAWLYNFYLDNILGTSLNTNELARDYQMAIWALENEGFSGMTSGAIAVLNSIPTTFTYDEQLQIDNIMVLNLSQYGCYRQDMLIRVTPGNIIPAPGAVLLGSIGVGLIGWLRRRRVL